MPTLWSNHFPSSYLLQKIFKNIDNNIVDVNANSSFICNNQTGSNGDMYQQMNKQIVYIHKIKYDVNNNKKSNVDTYNMNKSKQLWWAKKQTKGKNMYIIYDPICI